MYLTQGLIDEYMDTIWAIAASPYVKKYVIGFTAMKLRKRFYGHYSSGFDHIVILEDKMTRLDAHRLEKILQDMAKKSNNEYSYTLYRKYDEKRRNLRYYPSAGQATEDENALVHSVYMAWNEYNRRP